MLTHTIIYYCLQTLLPPETTGKEKVFPIFSLLFMLYKCASLEDLEALCKLLKSVGKLVDTQKNKKNMDDLFERISVHATKSDVEPRIRYLLRVQYLFAI